MSRAVDSPVLYFGKLPSRGDFVRSAHSAGLVQAMDAWLSGGMELASEDARWKLLYDRAAPVQFAVLSSRQTRAMVGYLSASQDASGRRFPFVTAATLECENPLHFLARAPLALLRPWSRLGRWSQELRLATDATAALAELGGSSVSVESDGASYDASFDDFCEMQTVGSLQSLLTAAGHPANVRQLMLGLGLLLEPVMSSGENQLQKGLQLPLPLDPLQRPIVAAFWLELVAPFLSRASFDLALFQQEGSAQTAPALLLGFEGSSGRSLHALLDPEQSAQLYLDVCQAEWVEESVSQNYGLHKLSSYLHQDGLSLRQAVNTFKEVFMGR